MSDHYYHYHHPKPRYYYNYLPYYYNYYPYYYPYYYSYGDQDICFCTDDTDVQKVCVGDTCGVCTPRSLCSKCHETITCQKQVGL